MTTAVQDRHGVRTVTDAATGESLALVPQDAADAFSLDAYLSSVTSGRYVEQQQQLAAAYDTACKALIGPNDVQKEGSREFKKKSAWRKLQRHFRINTEIRSIRYVDVVARGSVHSEDRVVTTAEVTVEAIAPWGQRVQAVGACGYDEETLPEQEVDRNGTPVFWESGAPKMKSKGKELSLADMVATAETRATNRAISNLIAMGEVSAEEIKQERAARGREGNGNRATTSSGGRDATSRENTGSSPSTTTASFDRHEKLRFGKHKGSTYEEIATHDLQWLCWLYGSEKEKPADDRHKRPQEWLRGLRALIKEFDPRDKTEGDTAGGASAHDATTPASSDAERNATSTTSSSPTAQASTRGATDEPDFTVGEEADDGNDLPF